MSSDTIESIIIAISGMLFALIWIFLSYVIYKRQMMKSSYKGRIIDKKSWSTYIPKFYFIRGYTLIIKIDGEQTKKVSVTKNVYDQFNIGDKIIKNVGELNPIKG